jgi:hypothetical protein
MVLIKSPILPVASDTKVFSVLLRTLKIWRKQMCEGLVGHPVYLSPLSPGVSILFKKPMKKPPNLFSFLSPLSLDVWIYWVAAYLGVSVLLFILAR